MPEPSREELGFELKQGFKVDGRWIVQKKLGEGAFGAVYKVIDGDGQFKNEEMALKLESLACKCQVLKIEVAVLKDMKGEKHACTMFARGRNNRYSFMVMSLLGPSLDDRKLRNGGRTLTLSTAVRITFQCLKCLRDMHTCGWLHRDVKPSNFALGPYAHNRRTVYIFDFGLARRFRKRTADVVNKNRRDWVGFRGTMRYCSVNAHKRMDMGRHDDLVCLLYSLVEYVKGVLPWSYNTTHEQIMKSKEESGTTIYKDLPESVVNLHNYLYSLTYDDQPKYSTFELVLLDMTHNMGFAKQPLDWEKNIVERPATPSAASVAPLERFPGEGPGDRENVGVPDLPNTNYNQ